MKAATKARRLIRIVELLADDEHTTRELAEMLNVSQRTVSRDLRDLQALSVGVWRAGDDWSYRARRVPDLVPPEPLTDEERALVRAWRRLDEDERRLVARLIDTLPMTR